jgi:phosphodiesterase/alkaline phosphatase D-like protein
MRRTLLVATFALLLTSLSQAQTAPKSDALTITHGPTVEFTGSDRAIIAWSTNASSGTIVTYGTDQKDLSKKAEAPWGALTHRVTLKNLQPNTIYFFKVDSPHGAGTGTTAESTILQFQTKAANATAQK